MISWNFLSFCCYGTDVRKEFFVYEVKVGVVDIEHEIVVVAVERHDLLLGVGIVATEQGAFHRLRFTFAVVVRFRSLKLNLKPQNVKKNLETYDVKNL